MGKKRANPESGPVQIKKDKFGYTDEQAYASAEGGLFSTDAGVPCRAQYISAQNETVIVGSCAYITLGKDRPDTQASGKGSDGFVGTVDESYDSSRVDIVVGRMAAAREGKGVKPGTFVNNSFQADAARIYICETTDVDKNFGLSEGVVGNAKKTSSVVVKSDHTRIIGREGIKIVTGGMRNVRSGEETNSKGGKLPTSPGIDLIAGNNTEAFTSRGIGGVKETIQRIQPVAVAFNVRDCFLELDEILDDIMSSITNLSKAVGYSFTATASAMASLSVVPGIGAAATSAATVIAANNGLIVARASGPLHAARATKFYWSANFLNPAGYKFIGSRSIRATY